MNRKLLVASATLFCVLLVAPAVGAAPWMQPRGDAAATGFQPDEGPAWKDVALQVGLPGGVVSRDGPPLILEDRVLLTATPTSYGGDDGIGGYEREGADRILSVNLATGNVTEVGRIPEEDGAPGLVGGFLATDGETVYVGGERSIHAISLGPEGHEWTWRYGSRAPPGADTRTYCHRLNLEPRHLTVTCYEAWDEERTPVYDQHDVSGGDVALVARLDTRTGEASWVFERPPPPGTNQPEGPPSTRAAPIGLTVAGPIVAFQTWELVGQGASVMDAGGGAEEVRSAVWGLDVESGDVVWNWTSEPLRSARTWPSPAGDPLESGGLLTGNPTASQQAVYVTANAVHKLALGSGKTLWEEPIGEEDLNPGLAGLGGLGYHGGQVFATSAQTAYRLGAEQPESGWSTSINLSGGAGFDEPLVLTPDTVYVAAETGGGETPNQTGPLYALDRDDGDVMWTHRARDVWGLSAGEGVIAYTNILFEDEEQFRGSLTVLGRTPASPSVDAEVPSAYPAPGEAVEVDLSGSTAGVQGPVTRFKAIWGDGHQTPWQSEPVMTHVFEQRGNVTARFVVGNEANQTNSTTQTFHVGGQVPTEPNLLETAFQRENQDMTFGVLGIVLAVGGGAVGVARRHRKRSRLQDELDAVEEAYEETKDRPLECEAQLTERKTHARGLLLDGELDQEQFRVVEDRIEELLRELRLEAVEAFDFLPHRLVTALREVVEDGQVTETEKEGVLAMLEDDDALTGEYKERVRAKIDAWYERDARR